MIMLVFSLVAGSILVRTSQNTQATIGSRQSQVSYNLATPAVERAKSKIEFLFKRDYRFPNGIPTEEMLERMMINKSNDPALAGYEENGAYLDIYTLPKETRIDTNGDNQLDNAWLYDTDIDGDGVDETVVYSILMRNSRPIGTNSYIGIDGKYSYSPANSKNKVYSTTTPPTDSEKASQLITRTGPLTLLNGMSLANCSIPGAQGEKVEGWYSINTATVRKNFQVNAVVVKKNDAVRTVSSVEFQQDRQMDMGNKWGVWFRYDLEAYPGPAFNWNGAMHTEGNLLWGDTGGGTGISAYLISSPFSCLYTEDASEITLAQYENTNGQITFQGQMLNANPTPDNYNGISEVDLFPGAGIAPTGSNKAVHMKQDTDSVKDSLQTGSPYQFSLNPITVFTEDRSISRYTSDPTNASVRSPNWIGNSSNLDHRMLNKLIRRPYLDDTYRADDRWGPKPSYTHTIKVGPTKYGEKITGAYLNELTRENPPAAFPDDVGLDGYWERRARVEGLRLIVGPRLDLGNTFGWKGNNDPLYPPNNTSLKNLARQRRTLRDNLAAVQSTLIYHYNNNTDFPVATLATTVHPGTTQSLAQNTNFNLLPYKFQNVNLAIPDPVEKDHVYTNFLTGVGTNGWEFNPPGNVTNQADFAALIEDNTNPLRIALNNLALFAGDSDGGFPPKKEMVKKIIHPHPDYMMWGNFSQLRQILLNANGSPKTTLNYSDLSIADRTTVQTAASTIGLLAYNLDSLRRMNEAFINNSGMTALGEQFWQLLDGNSSNGEINDLVNPPVPFPTGYIRGGDGNGNGIKDELEFYSQFTPEQYINALLQANGLGSQANKEELINKATMLITYAQVERDRLFGFQQGDSPVLTGPAPGSTWTPNTLLTVGNGSNEGTFKPPCDPEIFSDMVGTSNGKETKKMGMAMALCLVNMPPKYPSLYFIFPKYNHNYLGLMPGSENGYGPGDNQPVSEEYIADTYLALDRDISDVFKVLKPVLINPAPIVSDKYKDDESSLASIALQPKTLDDSLSDWKLPRIISSSDPTPTGNTGDRVNNIVFTTNNVNYARIPFLDKAFYDARQQMVVRALDVDLKMLKDNSLGTDTWLTKSGIIYAFREDAIREDDIARPAGTTFTNCDTEAEVFNTNCRMNVSDAIPQDPPNNGLTGVSLKPVDYYPDPDRRPHSFRLINGSDISRSGTNMGFSFISDNPIYIQGNLNLHQNSSGQLLEEFTQKLDGSWSNFYTRNTLDTNFARPASDRWRPVEILGDALTVLSNNFCDGTIEDGFTNTSNTCFSGSTSSYLNSTLANANTNTWTRENPNDLTSPIAVTRNADIRLSNGSVFTNYRTLGNGKTRNPAINTSMNAIFINGLVPARRFQSYGGLHNFPRFIEDWDGDDLNITGAFVQLKFSTYATAPWDQEAWEPGENPSTGETIPFYAPPNRKWGYDVALQYNAPGPVAARFISVGSPRNEFYQQLAADDPYTKQLRCLTVNGKKIDPRATDCP
ncbi:hypothetical protein CFPU101_02430 [Chroococcus sp. FPU101]|nr:hypothetical protein CFPU101_02430 [Chroococcus sp. FPU101]